MNFLKLLDPVALSSEREGSRADAVSRFLDPNSGITRFVIGRNPQSDAVNNLVPLAGLIDDRAEPGTLWNGLPGVAMSDVPCDASVLNCSTSISPVSVARALARAGLHQTLNISDLIRSPACPAGLLPTFVTDQHREIAEHANAWQEIYDRLADDESKQVLTDVLRFRLTADPSSMESYSVRIRDQYFEDFLRLSQEVFVDAGGFDGDTTEQFCKRVPDYRHIFFIEPSAQNMAAAKIRLAGFPCIDYLNVGLSDAAGELSFDASSGSASSISSSGAEKIKVDLLDNVVDAAVTFVKMDLEGWELHALRGSAEHIRTDRPKLAISVYHQASHFREVFNFVLGLCPDYRVHLRHYTEGWSETVMFFTL